MVNISYDEFSNAVTSSGYEKPSREKYNGFIASVDYAGINSKNEAAMYLAQLIHESGGLKYKEEIAYADQNSSPYDNSEGFPGKSYHGRGYIQLTHSYNYKAASQDILDNDGLLRNPERVSSSEDLAFKTAGWYWKTRVGNQPRVRAGDFDATTNAINGGLEPPGRENPNRKKYYLNAKNAFGL